MLAFQRWLHSITRDEWIFVIGMLAWAVYTDRQEKKVKNLEIQVSLLWEKVRHLKDKYGETSA